MVAARDDSCELLDTVENDDGSHMAATGRGGAGRAAIVACARMFFSSFSATCKQLNACMSQQFCAYCPGRD